MGETDWERFMDRLMAHAPLWKRIRWRVAKWKMATARRWLRAHDPDFSSGEAVDDLLRRRQNARARGIGPGDPEYPRLAIPAIPKPAP